MHYSLGFLGHDICTNFSYDFCSKTFLACIMHFKNQIVLFALSYIFVAFMYFPLSDMCFEIQPKPEVKIESSICTNLFDLTKFVLHVSGHYFCTKALTYCFGNYCCTFLNHNIFFSNPIKKDILGSPP